MPREVSSHTSQQEWLNGIEILRGIAALSVVLHHCWSLSHQPRFTGYWLLEGFGTWGVSLFFVLSGFLLADHFWRGERRGRLRRFYTRRFLRIIPAYYFNLFVLFLFFANHQQLFSSMGFRQVISNITFTHYLRPATASSLNVNGALWTLTIEMILYLLMPVMSWFTRVTRGIGALLMAAAGLGYRLVVARAGEDIQDLYFPANVDTAIARLYLGRQFFGVLALFAIGIGLKWMHTRHSLAWPTRFSTRLPRAVVVSVLLAPSAMLLVFVERASFYTHWVWFTGFEFVIGILFVPVLLFVSRPAESPGNPVDRAAAWLGERSYGLYLWHFPIILSVYGRGPSTNPPESSWIAARIAVILLMSIIAAHFSWQAIEAPAQSLARRLTARPSGDTPA